jgi:hypothetical protein
MSRIASVACTAAVLAVVGVSVLAPAASADTYVVTRSDDPALNTCASDGGGCSLRGAVVKANNRDGHDTVLVPDGTYTLSVPRTSFSQFSDHFRGDLDVTDSLTVRAPVRGVTIDGNGLTTLDRVLEVKANLVLQEVHVAKGVAPLDADNVARGGGIRVNGGGALFMQGGHLHSNRAAPPGAVGEGGGIYSEGTATLEGVTVTSNRATLGGGVFTRGNTHTSLISATVRSNQAGAGGGLAVVEGSTASIDGSRVGANDATSGGGGGIWATEGAAVEIVNSNLDANTATSVGGGALLAVAASAAIRSSTVTKNSSTGGGGIFLTDPPGGNEGEITLANSIIAENADPDDTATTDCRDNTGGRIVSEGYNVVGFAFPCTIAAGPGDQIGGGATGGEAPIVPVLGPVDFYGGPAFVLVSPLDPRSPAVDTGAPADLCPKTDLRGMPRQAGDGCDTGAYEFATCERRIVNRVGTQGGDTSESATMAPLLGSSNALVGLGGADELTGAGQDDSVCGSTGSDVLRGEAGSDRLNGGKGRDVCIGGPGRDSARNCEVERSIP